MYLNEYEPYQTFEEYCLRRIKEKHKFEWQHRTGKILTFLKTAHEKTKEKLPSSYIAMRYNQYVEEEYKKSGAKLKPITPNTVIRCMQDLRYQGNNINADVTGYWINNDPEDVYNTICHLEDKINGIKYTISKLIENLERLDYEYYRDKKRKDLEL